MKHKLILIAGYVLLTTILTLGLYGVGQGLASSSNREAEWYSHDDADERDLTATVNPAYVEECGSCHMAYPARLLPAESWRRIMQGLGDHFGENAEVDTATRNRLEQYLVSESGSVSYQKLFRNLGHQVPLRITGLPYFRHKHDGIPSKLIQANDKVGSLSQCNACHQKAERGLFDEDDVNIPGFGRWDD